MGLLYKINKIVTTAMTYFTDKVFTDIIDVHAIANITNSQ